MANIKPFRAIRPKQGLECRIAALPYDVYNRAEAKAETLQEPMSFLKIDRAETQFEDTVDTYADMVYERAHDTFWDMVGSGDFVREADDCYYLYELTMEGRSQTGIVACAAIDDYVNEVIKKHENTRADKEEDRIRHVDALNAQTGPIFLAYRSKKEINEVVSRIKQNAPVYDFIAPDGIRHAVWIVSGEGEIETIQNSFTGMSEIYIADGHHRCASAVKVGLKRRFEKGSFTGKEEFNYFLSVLFPDDQLMIMDYNRVVKDLNGASKEDILETLKKIGVLTNHGENSYKPEKKGDVGIYFDHSWYHLRMTVDAISNDPVETLDVSILQNYVLEPLFGIQDPKTDQRIDFVGGIRGLKELERRVCTDSKIAFAMYPTSISELFAVADAGKLMPPKSTWFEPKLRSGLFIHEIDR
ncbi:MAG: DUF1015 family protein [Lachnospiraceae bacterium]